MSIRGLSVIAICLLTGCATEHFGREQRLTVTESNSIDCAQIDLEITKVDEFLRGVDAEWSDTKGRRFGAFLVDFGIGNHRERSDAIESADARRQQLVDLRTRKSCPGAVATRPETD